MKQNQKWSLFPYLLLIMTLSLTGVCHAGSLGGTKDKITWDEEYTDTDTEKGTLAVRCEAFQGFKGEVTISLTGMTGGRTITIILDKDREYIANLTLGRETYQVTELTAMSESREYDCYAEPKSFTVENDTVTICKVTVNPGSVRTFPEETEFQLTEPASEPEIAGLETQTEPVSLREQTKRETNQRHIPILAVFGIVLIVVSAGSLIYLWNRKE